MMCAGIGRPDRRVPLAWLLPTIGEGEGGSEGALCVFREQVLGRGSSTVYAGSWGGRAVAVKSIADTACRPSH